MSSMYDMLTAYEHLEFIARAYKLKNWQKQAGHLLLHFELDDKKNKLGKELSNEILHSCDMATMPKKLLWHALISTISKRQVEQMITLSNAHILAVPMIFYC